MLLKAYTCYKMGHMDQSWVKLEPNLGQIRPKLAQNTNWTRVPILIVETTDYRPHCSVSLYLFHGQITQKAVHQLSDPENKKCSHWKFFGTIYLQTLWFLSRRGPRSPDMCRSLFIKLGNFFSAEIWKVAECHFWANVMLRHSHSWASRASPTQNPQDLRVVCSKQISMATFFVF